MRHTRTRGLIGLAGAVMLTMILASCTMSDASGNNGAATDPVEAVKASRTARYDLREPLTRADVGLAEDRSSMFISADGSRDDLIDVEVVLPGDRTLEVPTNTLFLRTDRLSDDPDRIVTISLRRSFADLDDAYAYLLEASQEIGIDRTEIDQWHINARLQIAQDARRSFQPRVWTVDDPFGHVHVTLEADLFVSTGAVGVLHHFDVQPER